MSRGWLVPCVLGLVPAALAQERVDLDAVHRIKQEAIQGSQVMDHLFQLTDVNGPRLTGSPGFKRAADWAVARLQGWGLAGARLEGWGRFGRGWSLDGTPATWRSRPTRRCRECPSPGRAAPRGRSRPSWCGRPCGRRRKRMDPTRSRGWKSG